MILGAELAMLVMGIMALWTGKLTLTKRRVVYGAPARLLGIIGCMPLPLSFIAGVAYALTKTRMGINPANGATGWHLAAIEGGILLLCTAVIYAIGWSIADSPVEDIGTEDETPGQTSEIPSIAVVPESKTKVILVVAGVGILLLIFGLSIGGSWYRANLKGSDNPSAALSRETPDSDVDAIPPAPLIAGPVPASLLPTPWQPRVDRMLQWNRRSLRDAYDKVGKKSPKWDEHACTALELTAVHFSNLTDPRAQARDIHAATQKSLDAGCDDPLIFYLHVRSADPTTPADKLDRGFAKAAKLMQSSDYPPIRRAMVLWKAAESKMQRHNDPGAKAEALRFFAAALQLLPVSAREEERCHDLEDGWYQIAHDAFAAYRKPGQDPRQTLQGIDEILATEKALEATRHLLQGEYLIQKAWQARGSGTISTVTADQQEKFNQRLTQARQALEKSWQLAPHYGKPATFMLNVELGQSRGRAEMEKWFEHAIQFDPSVNVCMLKLEWLHPKWHGSTEEMLAFGRACRDSENWDRRYPLIIVDTHQRMADMLPDDAAKTNYFRQPDVVADILYVYAKACEHAPTDASLRSRYGYYSYICGHPRRAHREFEQVGDKLRWGGIFTETLMKQTRAKAAKEGGKS